MVTRIAEWVYNSYLAEAVEKGRCSDSDEFFSEEGLFQ